MCVQTRPDIATSISILSQHVSKPHQDDWNELKRVLRYLKGTINLSLALSGVCHTGDLIYGYADASYAECRIDRKSQSGHIIFVNGGVTSWLSRKQSCVAISSTEAEYLALAKATQEIIWLKRI